MPTARPLRVFRRSEDGRIADRALRPPSCGERILHRVGHRDDLLESRFVCLGAPADGAVLKVHVIPPQVAPRRDTPSRSLDEHRPHDRAAWACLVEAHTPAWFTDGLRPAPPGLPGHSFLRSWAMPWASVTGSYGGAGESATRFKSPRRTW